jgi:broad specificity phosphatase PhoE
VGETDEEAVTRFMKHLRELAIAYPGKKLLISSHGGIMRYFLIKLGWAKYKDMDAHAVLNTSYIQVECDGTDFFIKELYQIEKANV